MNNKEYYNNTFDEVHIPKELFGKVVQMNDQKRKKHIDHRIAVAAGLVLLCAAAGSSSYAAIKHAKLTDFFAEDTDPVPEPAKKLIKNEPEQKLSETAGTDQQLSDLVDVRIEEVLCDAASIHCNVAAVPKDTEKYLLVPYDLYMDASMENLGIQGEDKKLSIQEYAEKYHKKLLYISLFIEEQEVSTHANTGLGNKLDADGTLHSQISMDDISGKTDIKCTCTIELYEEEKGQEHLSGQLDFTVHDNSTIKTVEFIPDADSNLENTGCLLDRVSLRKTEAGAYVIFDYHVSKKTKVNTEKVLDGISYELVDAENNILPAGLSGGGNTTDLGDGKYQCNSNYKMDQMPKQIRVKVFDCWSKKVYGYIDIAQK